MFMGNILFVIQPITQTIRARQSAFARPISVPAECQTYIVPHTVKQQGVLPFSVVDICLPVSDTIYLQPTPKQIPNGQTNKPNGTIT